MEKISQLGSIFVRNSSFQYVNIYRHIAAVFVDNFPKYAQGAEFCLPHKGFLVGWNSPFMRLAEHLTALLRA